MNKYQEALDCVTGITRKMLDNPTVEFSKKYLKSIKLLEELVDKATPFKPVEKIIYYDNNYFGKCKCGEGVYDHNFNCSFCGQTLDWTKNVEV